MGVENPGAAGSRRNYFCAQFTSLLLGILTVFCVSAVALFKVEDFPQLMVQMMTNFILNNRNCSLNSIQFYPNGSVNCPPS